MLIEIKRGETLKTNVWFREGENLIDLSNFEILFTIKKNKEDLDKEDKVAIVKKTLRQVETGKAILFLSEEDTFHPSGTYAFDFKIRRDDGEMTKIGVGEFIINGVATNR